MSYIAEKFTDNQFLYEKYNHMCNTLFKSVFKIKFSSEN